MLKIIASCLFCIIILNIQVFAQETSLDLEVQLDVLEDVTFYKL